MFLSKKSLFEVYFVVKKNWCEMFVIKISGIQKLSITIYYQISIYFFISNL